MTSLCSIEMIEAVGHHFLDTYLKVCADRLKDDGMMRFRRSPSLTRPTIADRKSVDFILTL